MGNHLKNWTCAVFNEQGKLNASRETDGMESIHIAFQGAYSKPLVAVLADKRSPHLHRNSEPNWIFSMGNVFSVFSYHSHFVCCRYAVKQVQMYLR